MEQDSIPFGMSLKRLRQTHDLTQEELASQIGCVLVTHHKAEALEEGL